MVDAHLADTFADRLDVAKVAGSGQAENSGIDSGDRLPIFQLGKPSLEGVALMDFNHGKNVIHDSHIGKGEYVPALAARLYRRTDAWVS